MTEKDKNFDENDPKIKEKLRVLEAMNAETDANIKDWQGMYDNLKGLARAYIDNPSKHQADFTVTAMLSFVLALEMLPEEGDIAVITRKMNEILVMRDDLTGATIYVGEEAEKRHAQDALEGAVVLASLVGSLAAAAEAIDSDEDQPASRTVH